MPIAWACRWTFKSRAHRHASGGLLSGQQLAGKL